MISRKTQQSPAQVYSPPSRPVPDGRLGRPGRPGICQAHTLSDEGALAAFTASLSMALGPMPPPPRSRTASPKPMPNRQACDDNTRSLPVAIAPGGRGPEDRGSSGLPSPEGSTPSYFFDLGSRASSYRVGQPIHSGGNSPVPGFHLGNHRSRVSSVDRQTRVREHQHHVAQLGTDVDNPPMSPLYLPESDSSRPELRQVSSPVLFGARRSLELAHGGTRRPLVRVNGSPILAVHKVQGFDLPLREGPAARNMPHVPISVPMQRGQSSYGAGEGAFEIFRFEQDQDEGTPA